MKSKTATALREGATALRDRVRARADARSSPPPADWVDPQPTPLKEGEVPFNSVTEMDLQADLSHPGKIGMPI